MWNLTRNWIRTYRLEMSFELLLLVLATALASVFGEDVGVGLRRLTFLLLCTTNRREDERQSYIVLGVSKAQMRVLRALPLARGEIADWLWAGRVIQPALFLAAAGCISRYTLVAMYGGKEAIAANPLVLLAGGLVVGACGTWHLTFPRSARTALDWLIACVALPIAMAVIWKAPFAYHHLDGVAMLALALGAVFVPISFAQRHKLGKELDPVRKPTRGLAGMLGAITGRILRLSKEGAGPARWPRLTFYVNAFLAPIFLLSFIVPALALSSVLNRTPLRAEGEEGWAAAGALAMIVALALPLPSLRAQRQWPLSRMHLALWYASHYAAAGVTIALAILPLLALGHVGAPQIAAADLCVISACVLLGGLRTMIGERRESDWILLALGATVTILSLAIISACIQGSALNACAIAILASLAMAGGAALLYRAVAYGSASYRDAPPGVRIDQEEG